ncbi:MAG: hypothetical protein JWQ87_1059 [Candidatus Sulfotelmatobacter sp.]|nr:hypothetical protein [Candidatus Sulfotelmatobacter sp.]
MSALNTIMACRSVDAPATRRRVAFLLAGLSALIIASSSLIDTTAAAKPVLAQNNASPALSSQSYEGVITDTRCGAKHSAAIGMAAADCTRVCVHGGEQFALVDGDNVYVLEGNLQQLKRMAGQRVRILGNLNGTKISVSAVTPGK